MLRASAFTCSPARRGCFISSAQSASLRKNASICSHTFASTTKHTVAVTSWGCDGCCGGIGEGQPARVDGDAAERSFDAVVARSVLIYLAAKAAAFAEFHRVPRPGGRLSLFEPINRVGEGLEQPWGADDGELAERDRRVRAHQRARQEWREAMLGFDERDLLAAAIAAGFATVELSYELRYSAGDIATPEQLASNLRRRPAPTIPSYAEAALGAVTAAEHLAAPGRRGGGVPAGQASGSGGIVTKRASDGETPPDLRPRIGAVFPQQRSPGSPLRALP